ncbi:MAG: SpoIIE family protein phosphatase, partial [Thermoleophilaceae bacterium]
QRSVITRALGTEPDVDVDIFTVEALPGDLFLLCSDGLTTMVPDAELLDLAAGSRADLEAVARALVNAANAAGGEDNVTVVAFELEEGDPPAELPAAADVEPAPAPAPEEQTVEMRRHGAMPGGRLGAFAAIAGTGLAALLLVWGLKR